MKINVRKEGRVTILYISGKMTIGKGDVTLRENFKELLGAGERFFIFHMTQVSYLDSAGVGEMIACVKRAYQRGGIIKIVLLPKGKAREVFAVACLDKVFEIFTNEEAALAGFQV